MGLPTQANVSRPVAAGYHFLIDYGDTDAESLYLRGAVGPGREFRLQTVAVEQGPDTGANPEDMRGETGNTFSRSGFTGGEGLDRAHRRDGTDRDWSRFWDSRNVEVTPGRAGNPDEVKLLHSASSLRSEDASGVDRAALARVGTVLYGIISDNTQVDRTADPTASSPTWTVEDPFGGGAATALFDLAALGNEVYVAAGSIGIYQRDGSGTWSFYSTPSNSHRRLWGVKGRIIAADGAPSALTQSLVEVKEDPDLDIVLHTLPPGETWTDVVDAGVAILAGASNGEVYAFVDEDGTLALRARFVFEGEEVTALGFGQGFVFVGTGEPTTSGGAIGRLWRCQIIGLRFQGNQVVREWGDGSTSVDRSPQRIISTREAVYTGVIEDGTESHLWKYHLETGGITRDLILNDGLVQGLAVVDDRKFASVEGDGLFREDTTYASTGYLISPLADFFNAAKKSWVGARLTTGTMPTGTDLVLAYSTDPDAITDDGDSSWTTVISADENSSGDLGETSITGVESRYIAGKLTLTPNGAATSTPVGLAFSFRGLPIPTEEDYAVPVNVSDRLEIPGRRSLTVPGIGHALLDQLHSLKGSAVTFTVLRDDEQVIGQLRSIGTPYQEVTSEGSLGTFSQVTVRGVRQ